MLLLYGYPIVGTVPVPLYCCSMGTPRLLKHWLLSYNHFVYPFITDVLVPLCCCCIGIPMLQLYMCYFACPTFCHNLIYSESKFFRWSGSSDLGFFQMSFSSSTSTSNRHIHLIKKCFKIFTVLINWFIFTARTFSVYTLCALGFLQGAITSTVQQQALPNCCPCHLM